MSIIPSGMRYVKTVSNEERVVAQNYYDAIADNKIENHFPLHKFGHNAAVGTTEEIIWTAGNGYTYLSAVETLQVSSSDANDTSAGSGARTVTLEGLDANWVELSETVTLNGAASVETSSEFLRIFRVYVATAGSSETNEGLISIKNNADVVDMAEIVAGMGQSQMAMRSVPAGNKMFVKKVTGGESANKKVTVRLYFKDNTIADSAWRLQPGSFDINLSNATLEFSVPLVFTEKCDIELRAVASVVGGNVIAGFEGYYES
jgi:hypothetical protein